MRLPRPAVVILTFIFITISGCTSNEEDLERIKMPLSWLEECNYITSTGSSMPCNFNSTSLQPLKPETALCTAIFNANGITIMFSYDDLREMSWFSYESQVDSISGIIYNENSISQFMDGPKAASFPLPWKGKDEVISISIYRDFLFHSGNMEIGPESGSQEFIITDGNIFTISRWLIGDTDETYIGYSEDGLLMPIGTESWIDNSGAAPSISSFKKFIYGSGLNTLSPQGCLASTLE